MFGTVHLRDSDKGWTVGGLPASLDLTVLLGFVEVESHMVPQASLELSL